MNPNEPSNHSQAGEQGSPKAPKPPVKAKKPLKIRKGPLIAAGATLAILCLGVAPRMEQSHKLAERTQALASASPLVSTMVLKPTESGADVTLPSNVQSIDAIAINARASGYVRQCLVDIGSHVRRGQVLAVVESPEIDQQVSQNEAEVARSVAGLGQARADASKRLADVSAAQADVRRNEAGLMQAQADLDHLVAKRLEAESALKVARAKQKEALTKSQGADAGLNRAKAGLSIAQKTYDRWKELEKASAVSGQEVDEKQAAFESGQAQVQAAQADVATAKAEIEEAEGAVRSAEADLQAARADVVSGQGRVRAAQSALQSSRADVQAAQANYQAGQSGIDAASATIRSDRANVDRTVALQSFERIVAPFNGVVTARNVDVGDLVSPTGAGTGATDPMSTVTKTGLFGLARTDAMRAQVNVPEDAVSLIHEGQDAEVTVREYPGRAFHGSVFHVSGALDAASRTLLVEVRVPNLDGALKPGMYAQIRFLGGGSRSTLRIPATALIFDAQGTRVATVTPQGTIHFVAVKLGEDDGDQIQVLQGLQGNETLVTNPDDSLAEGVKVRTQPASR